MSTTMARSTRTTDITAMRDTNPVTREHPDQALYAVVLHNDDRHTLRFCSTLLQEVFQCSEATACVLTWQIHTAGRAIVWSGNLEAVEQKCKEAERYQRLATDIEFRSPVQERNAGQPPMRTTIERVARDVAPGDGRQ